MWYERHYSRPKLFDTIDLVMCIPLSKILGLSPSLRYSFFPANVPFLRRRGIYFRSQ